MRKVNLRTPNMIPQSGRHILNEYNGKTIENRIGFSVIEVIIYESNSKFHQHNFINDKFRLSDHKIVGTQMGISGVRSEKR